MAWGFMVLVNRNGSGRDRQDQVYPATYQSVVFQRKSYYSIAPFFSHSVMEKGRGCAECHANERLDEYDATGKIVMTRWNQESRKRDVTAAIVPVPVDWRDTFQFDFVDFTGDLHQPGLPDKWVFLKHGADGTNMLTEFAEPLTEEQLEKLRMKVTGTQPSSER